MAGERVEVAQALADMWRAGVHIKRELVEDVAPDQLFQSWFDRLASVQEQGFHYMLCERYGLPWRPASRRQLDCVLHLATRNCVSPTIRIVKEYNPTNDEGKRTRGSRLDPLAMCYELGFDWATALQLGKVLIVCWRSTVEADARMLEQQLGVTATGWR